MCSISQILEEIYFCTTHKLRKSLRVSHHIIGAERHDTLSFFMDCLLYLFVKNISLRVVFIIKNAITLKFSALTPDFDVIHGF